jgi:serine/threonine protein kinase
MKDPAAKALLLSGQKLLKAVDASDFCSNHIPTDGGVATTREFPLFDRSEITIGPVLGHGGFGIVYEVKRIVLKKPSSIVATSATSTTAIEQRDDDAANDNHHDHDELMDHLEDHPPPYDVEQARCDMAANARRYHTTMYPGVEVASAARYAIKRLRSDLTDLHRARGAIDLAIETKFLSRLSHPNIGMFYIVLVRFFIMDYNSSFCVEIK